VDGGGGAVGASRSARARLVPASLMPERMWGVKKVLDVGRLGQKRKTRESFQVRCVMMWMMMLMLLMQAYPHTHTHKNASYVRDREAMTSLKTSASLQVRF
jgi:hypothetical protein